MKDFLVHFENIDTSKVAVMISADHATPCINKGHSDDPVPVLISGDGITNDGSERFTEEFAKKVKSDYWKALK